MRRIFSFIYFLLWSISLCSQSLMQKDFEKFVSRFPLIEWSDFDSIARFGNLSPEISYQDYQKNMWYIEPQNGPDNVYNHIRNEQFDKLYGTKTPPPHVKMKDGGLMSAGPFLEYTPTNFLSEEISISTRYYPKFRVELPNDVVLLCLVVSLDADNGEYDGYTECFTFKKSTQQMISGLILSGQNSWAMIEPDKNLFIFELWAYRNYEPEDETEIVDPDWGNRYHFKLDPDGYFRMVDMKEKITIEKMYVNDSDGYVNVRKEMSTNSEVLYKLKNDVGVYVWLMPNSNWAEVIPIYKEKRGYIHKSRLK